MAGMSANRYRVARKGLMHFLRHGEGNCLLKTHFSGDFFKLNISFSSMKTSWVIIGLLLLAFSGTEGQVPQPDAAYQVTERGANQRVWQKTCPNDQIMRLI
jgi:hypothetical protein